MLVKHQGIPPSLELSADKMETNSNCFQIPPPALGEAYPDGIPCAKCGVAESGDDNIVCDECNNWFYWYLKLLTPAHHNTNILIGDAWTLL